MRHLLAPALLLLLTACGDGFSAVQDADSIEAYEAYIAENAESRFALQATTRLEELYLAAAKEEASLEAYDRYLTRFPEGTYRDKAVEQREQFLFMAARAADSPEAWRAYLTEYPKGDKEWRREAERSEAVAAYRPSLTIGEVTHRKVNLADDPKGPLNGWGFSAEVTNNGDKTLKRLALTLVYLHPEGHELGRKEWPVVAERWGVPMEEAAKEPMKPGDTRTWSWSTDAPPKEWVDALRLAPTHLVVVAE